MKEGQPLLDLGITPLGIWGDARETTVYAQALGNGRELIFRFSIDRDDPPRSPSLLSRIVACYHDLDVADDPDTFQEKSDMRHAIYSSIATAWPECSKDPAAVEPGVLIDIDTDLDGNVLWAAYRDPAFDTYLEFLHSVRPTDLINTADLSPPVVDFSQIVPLAMLGGQGCSKLVRLSSPTSNPPESPLFVFKGIDFQTYLLWHDDDGEYARAMVEIWRRSSEMVAEMPPHPNIQPPPKILVSICSPTAKHEPTFVGHLSTFYPKGDLEAHIGARNKDGKRIPSQQSARWCHQMSLAIAHTHRVLHTSHMDIKPANFLIDDSDNLILIDWEQVSAPPTTLAPEADGTWDVREQHGKLVYTKYVGPPRRNMPEGYGDQPFQIWNVFPEWNVSCPRASEQAEVFALGRTMWLLLSQMEDVFEEVEHPNDVQVSWGQAKKELPRIWVEIVQRCMDEDPNKRPSLAGLVKFWEMAEFWDTEEVAGGKPGVVD